MNNLDYRKITQALFYVNALIWVVIGIASIFRASTIHWIIYVLMFGNAFALALCGVLIRNPEKIYFFFATAVLALNIILSFTDQIGFMDILVLLFNCITLSFLWKFSRTVIKP